MLLLVASAAAGRFDAGRSAVLATELEAIGLSSASIKVSRLACTLPVCIWICCVGVRCNGETGVQEICENVHMRRSKRSSISIFIHVWCLVLAGGALEQAEATTMGEWIVALRRRLHKTPELMYDLTETAAIVREVLDELKIPYKYPVASHGIVATIGSGKQPVIALRSGMCGCARECLCECASVRAHMRT